MKYIVLEWILALCVMKCLHLSSATIRKQWLQNTNFKNSRNWDSGQLPCPNQKVVFPDPCPSIYLASELKVTSPLTLPANGEFLLGEGFSISAGSSRVKRSSDLDAEGQCNGTEEVRFNRTLPEEWFNPNNWCTLSSDGVCSQSQEFQLDSEKIPCQTDDVIFPPQSTFLVKVTNDVKVKSLNIARHTYSANNITSFFESGPGRNQFQLDSDVTFTASGKECVDPSGCACGNDNRETLHRICTIRLAQSTCPTHFCEDAILPNGHCCALCGAVLVAEYTFQFNMESVKRKVYSQYETDSVKIGISKTSKDQIQIVVTDQTNDGESAKPQANTLYAYLKRDIRDHKTLGLAALEIQSSGKGTNRTARVHSQRNSQIAHYAGVGISIVLVLCIIGLGMYCFVDRSRCQRIRDKIPTAVTFRRFSSPDATNETVEMSDNHSIQYLDILGRSEHQTTFDNPMFDIPDDMKPLPNDEEEKDDKSDDNAEDFMEDHNVPESDITEVVITVPDRTPLKDQGAPNGKQKHKKNKKKKSSSEKVTNNNEGPAVLDASSVTFESQYPGAMPAGNSFSNPLFRETQPTDYLDNATHISLYEPVPSPDDSSI